MRLAPFLGTLFGFYFNFLNLISYSTNPEMTERGHLTYFIRKKKRKEKEEEVVKTNLLIGFFYNFLNLFLIFF